MRVHSTQVDSNDALIRYYQAMITFASDPWSINSALVYDAMHALQWY